MISPEAAFWPKIFVKNGTVHLAWFDAPRTDHRFAVWYRKGTNQGGQWNSDPIRLNSQSNFGYYPDLKVNNNTVHVVWNGSVSSDPFGNGDIYYTKSSDNGSTWLEQVELTSNHQVMNNISSGLNLNSNNPNQVYLSWVGGQTGGNKDIFFLRSNNNGTSWGSVENVTAGQFGTHLLESPNLYSNQSEIGLIFSENVVNLWHKKNSLLTPVTLPVSY